MARPSITYGNHETIFSKDNYFNFFQGGQSLIYRYDKYGRVTQVILPTGEVVTLTAKLSPSNKLEVTVAGLNDRVTLLTMDGVSAKRLTASQGGISTECVSYRNGSMMSSTSWGGVFHSAAVAKFPLLELSLPIEAEMLPMWSYQVRPGRH